MSECWECRLQPGQRKADRQTCHPSTFCHILCFPAKVVTVSYRLGALGFLVSEDFDGPGNGGMSLGHWRCWLSCHSRSEGWEFSGSSIAERWGLSWVRTAKLASGMVSATLLLPSNGSAGGLEMRSLMSSLMAVVWFPKRSQANF